jgi:hypothetical protein
MVSRNILIGKVSPFLGKKEVVVANQDTVDIIDALIRNHYKYSSEYDKIYRYFVGDTVEDTAFNVWCFLKDEFKYNIEPEEMQILRSPAALLASNIVGIDCKGYATFACGIMDAYRRNTGKNFEVYYRFASYDPYDNTPQHVFAVVKNKGYEYWIDPVLDQFDEKKQPYYYKDKKIKNMALVAMSGINNYNSNYNQSIGSMDDDLGYSGDTSSNSSTPWWEVVFKSAPDIIRAATGQQPIVKGEKAPPPPPPSDNGTTDKDTTQEFKILGMSPTTFAIVAGAAVIGGYLLLSKKRK